MNERVLWALFATLGTWAVTALGAATVLFFRSPKPGVLNGLLGFAAGVMIAASFWSLLQPAIDRAAVLGMVPWMVTTAGFLTGALFMWGSDKALSYARGGTPNRMAMLVTAVTLHNIPEGLAVGVAFGALADLSPESLLGAATVAIGIGLQNFPEGAAVALPLRREGHSRRRSLFWGQASGMVEPIAGVLGAWLSVYMERLLPFALSFAAGAMILVAVHELIPECQREPRTGSYGATAGIVLGFAAMMLLDVALG